MAAAGSSRGCGVTSAARLLGTPPTASAPRPRACGVLAQGLFPPAGRRLDPALQSPLPLRSHPTHGLPAARPPGWREDRSGPGLGGVGGNRAHGWRLHPPPESG